MWETLANFSDERIISLYSESEPMKSFLFDLRRKEYAKEVYSYTSLFTFCVTLQPKYAPKIELDVIAVNYSSFMNGFSISYSDVAFQEVNYYFCQWKEIFNLFDALVLRLFLTKENEPVQMKSEEFPSFKVGQEVETTSHPFNQTHRRGKICKIVKHNKQNHFMYFLEENGKEIKKRYFKEHLTNK